MSRDRAPYLPLRRPSLLCAGLLGALGAGGCGEPDFEPSAELLGQLDDSELPPEVASSLAVAEVTASGTGCPAGSWLTRIHDDGKSFRIRLVGYEVQLDGERAVESKDCRLSIRVHSAVPITLALRSVAYVGYTLLDEGVHARFATWSYFDESAPSPEASVLELHGPREESFVRQEPAKQLAWSACGRERDVEVQTSIELRSEVPDGVGFLSVGEANGALPGAADAARFGITFSVRACEDSVPPSEGADAGATDAGSGEQPDAACTPVPILDAGTHDAEIVEKGADAAQT